MGAYDINNNIASFSSRGPSSFGGSDDQAEHLGAGRERPQQPPDQHVRQSRAARRWPPRTWRRRSP